MLNFTGQIPMRTDRDADPEPVADLWQTVLSEELPQQNSCVEWLFDKVEQNTHRQRSL